MKKVKLVQAIFTQEEIAAINTKNIKLEGENKKLSEKIGQLEEENRKLKEERDKYYAEWHLRHS